MSTTYTFYYKYAGSSDYEVWQSIEVNDPATNDGLVIPDASELGTVHDGSTSFKGWNNYPNSTYVAFSNMWHINNTYPKTYYAVFNSWDDIHYKDDDDSLITSEYQEITGTINDGSGEIRIIAQDPIKDGYTFLGWLPIESSALPEGYTGPYYKYKEYCSVDSDHELYAYWQANTYTVTFYKNNGTGDSTAGTGGPEQGITLSTLPSEGDYSFDHWNIHSDNSGTSYNAGTDFYPTQDMSLYAIWKYEYTSATYSDAAVIRSDSSGLDDELGSCAKIRFNCVWPKTGGDPIESILHVGCIKDGQTIVNENYEVSDDGEADFPLVDGLVNLPLFNGPFELTEDYTFNIEIIPDSGSSQGRASTSFNLYMSSAHFIVDVNEDGTRWAFGGVATNATGSDNFISGVEMNVPFIDGFSVAETLKGREFFKVDNEIETISGTAVTLTDSESGTLTKDLSSLIGSGTVSFDINMQYLCTGYITPKDNPNIGSIHYRNGFLTWLTTMNFNVSEDKTENVVYAFYIGSSVIDVSIQIQYTASNQTLVITPTHTESTAIRSTTTSLTQYQPKEYFAIPVIEFGTPPGAKDTNIWKGFYTDGEKRKIFELPNKTNNISIGYGAYEFINGGGALTGGNTNIYGRGIKLQTVEGIDIRTSSGQIASLDTNGKLNVTGDLTVNNIPVLLRNQYYWGGATGTKTFELPSSAITMILIGQVNGNVNNTGLYIAVAHGTTGTVAAIKASNSATVSINKTTLTITTSATWMTCTLLEMPLY